jgi:hypothetical protein
MSANVLNEVTEDQLFTGNVEILGEINNQSINNIITKLEKSSVVIQTVKGDFTDYIASIVSDSIIDITEKLTIRQLWNEIETEYPLILQRAADLGIPPTDTMYIAYQNRYAELEELLFGNNGILLDMTTPSIVDKVEVQNCFYEYYTAREALISGSVDKIVDWFEQTEREIAAVRMGDLIDGAITRAKLEAGFLEEHDSLITDIAFIMPQHQKIIEHIYPYGIDKISLPNIQGQTLTRVEALANALDEEILNRDAYFILTDNKFQLLFKKVADDETLLTSLSVLPGVIETITGQITNHGSRIGALEVGYNSIQTTLSELNVGGEIINLSLISQNADRIASIVSNGGYIDDNNIFHPTKAYTEVQQLTDRFQLFIQGSGNDAAAITAWIATKDEISQFITSTELDDELDPIRTDISSFQQTADEITLQVSQFNEMLDFNNYETREAYLAALEELGAQATAGIIVIQNRIDFFVQEQTDTNTQLYSAISMQADRITAEVARATNAEGILSFNTSAAIQMQADRITAEVNRASEAEGNLQASIQLLDNSITAEVTRASGEETNLAAAIQIQADRITAAVEDYQNADTQIYAAIQMEADRITAEVSRATASEDDISNTLSSAIQIQADRITAEVSRATGAESAMQSDIVQLSNQIISEVQARISQDSSLNSQIVQAFDSIATRIQAKTYNPNTGQYDVATEAFMALQVKLPETMSAERRQSIVAILTSGELTIFNRLYESYTASWRGGSETRYRLVAHPIQADIDSMTATFRTKGLLSSQFLVDAEEIFMKGTLTGEYIKANSITASEIDTSNLYIHWDHLSDVPNFGDLAFADTVDISKVLKNGQTIISGGFIKTELINAAALVIGYNQISNPPNFGAMAFEDAVELSKLGTTIISGGYIKTDLIDVSAIKAYEGFFNDITVTGRIYFSELSPTNIFTYGDTTTIVNNPSFVLNGDSGVYTRQLAKKIWCGGTFKVITYLDNAYAMGGTIYCRIYINGSPVGIEHSVTNGSGSWTENITLPSGGGQIEFWTKITYSIKQMYGGMVIKVNEIISHSMELLLL